MESKTETSKESKNDQKIVILRIINILFLLVWIGLIGVTVWPITELYTETNWWTGNGTIRDSQWTGWGSIVGTLGLIIHLTILRKKNKITPKAAKSFVISAGLITIVLTVIILPYFILPPTTADKAYAEFTKTYGAGWESKIHRPATGPWLNRPYSFFQLYGALPYDKTEYTLTLDIEFLKRGNDTFKCDLYLPKGTGPFPVLINIHGGGWTGLDKNMMINYQNEYFAAAGYAVFCVQYGAKAEQNMTRQYSMQEIMDNLASFSHWLANFTQTTQYHLNISRCFTVGLSAGGHLSALVGTARFNVSVWNPAVNVVGSIDYYGITDLRHWARINQQWLNASGLFNTSVLSDFALIDEYSPMTYVETTRSAGSSVVPLLVFHGDADSVVPVSQSREFDEMCDSRGYLCTYIEIPKGEHCFEGDNNSGMSQISLWAMERFMQLC